jgi:hypothetical protein
LLQLFWLWLWMVSESFVFWTLVSDLLHISLKGAN